MYSQSGEDAIILRHFKNRRFGRFLDLGAADGRTFSNTLALAELGWSGVCVEPIPRLAARLRHEHIARPSVLCVEAAIVPRDCPEGLVHLYDSNELVSSLSKDHAVLWAARFGIPSFEPIAVTGMHLNTLLRHLVDDRFDLVSIDCESVSTRLLFDLWDGGALPNMICVEHDGRIDEILKHPCAVAYREAGRTDIGGNLLLAL